MNKESLQEKVTLDSSLIEYLIYDKLNAKLDVMYKSGRHKGKIRSYTNFSEVDYHKIINSDSSGKELVSILNGRKKKETLWQKLKTVFSLL